MTDRAFSKVLVANRGEIAIRIFRALHELDIDSVAIVSDADATNRHGDYAKESIAIGGGHPHESYLDASKVLAAAERCEADAIHPGYGFFAENAEFAEACAERGIAFIGPPPSVIRAMGSKVRAREIMRAAGVPVIPGSNGYVADVDEALAVGDQVGYPLAIKAAAGGGGIGFRVALDASQVPDALAAAIREGERYFGDGRVYVERYLSERRHIEVQVIGDRHGNLVHLGERDCSTQRRHQKIIEEAPAPGLSEEMRRRICNLALEAAAAIGYVSAGTVDGLLSGDSFYFLEMNTRLQVEHCVTEAVTGIDIVKRQVAIAMGRALDFQQEDVVLSGVAIQCRINAERADRGFLPSSGTINRYREPSGPGVRVDSGIAEGSTVTPFYDSLLAKLIVFDRTREEATRRMVRALEEFEIEGVETLIPFHRALLSSDDWSNGTPRKDLVIATPELAATR